MAVAQAYNTICTDFEKLNEVKCMCGRDVTKDKSWSNKMFVRPDLMPHRVQMTGVRIERLQAISYEDCIKEGVIEHMDSRGYCYYYVKGMPGWFHSPHEAFAALINRPGVGRKGLWESNPWVVVYSFKLIK